MRVKLSSLLLASACVAVFAAPVPAAENDLARVFVTRDTVVWMPLVANDGFELIVSGRRGAVEEHRFERGERVELSRLDPSGEPRADGSLVWELRLIPQLDESIRILLQEARLAGDSTIVDRLCDEGILPADVVQSGFLTVFRGDFVPVDLDERLAPSGDADEETRPLTPAADRAAQPAAERAGGPVPRDFVIADDLIVDGSACIGFDCVNGESFGFDTIRLKENNLRIKFDDTSTLAGFPSRDWQLTANDSASGGASKFSVEDITGARVPFTLEAGAPSNSLFVDDGGRIGVRTATPSVEIHSVDGDTPTLRLEQTGASGFTPQTWDLAGNETNFFVRDVTGGSRLPLRIRPGAPSNSIDISASGNVGIGTTAAPEKLTVHQGLVLIRFPGNAGNTQVGFNLESTGGTVDETWFVRNNPANGAFTITDNAGGAAPFKIFPNIAADTLVVGTAGGVQRVSVAGALFVNGSQMNVPDYVFEPEYDLESIADHAEFMWTNKHLPAVPKAERDEQGRPSYDVLGTQFGVLEEVEKAHIYIEQLHGTIQQLQAEVARLSESVSKLSQGSENR